MMLTAYFYNIKWIILHVYHNGLVRKWIFLFYTYIIAIKLIIKG